MLFREQLRLERWGDAESCNGGSSLKGSLLEGSISGTPLDHPGLQLGMTACTCMAHSSHAAFSFAHVPSATSVSYVLTYHSHLSPQPLNPQAEACTTCSSDAALLMCSRTPHNMYPSHPCPNTPTYQAEVCSAKEALDLLRRAAKARQSAGTGINQHSSRSHAIYTIKLVRGPAVDRSTDCAGGIGEGGEGQGGGRGTSEGPCEGQGGASVVTVGVGEGGGQLQASYLHFVDLAGCERVARTGNSGARLRCELQPTCSRCMLWGCHWKEGGACAKLPFKDLREDTNTHRHSNSVCWSAYRPSGCVHTSHVCTHARVHIFMYIHAHTHKQLTCMHTQHTCAHPPPPAFTQGERRHQFIPDDFGPLPRGAALQPDAPCRPKGHPLQGEQGMHSFRCKALWLMKAESYWHRAMMIAMK